MDTILTVIATVLSIAVVLLAFFAGYRAGKKSGAAAGRQDAVTDLILAKDPEAWDKAHFLEVENIEKKKLSEATTTVVRRPTPQR